MSVVLARPGLRRGRKRNLRNKKDVPAEQHVYSNWNWGNAFSTHVEQKRFEPSWCGQSSKVQEPHNGGNGQWGGANKRGGASMCSRSWPLRGCAITRRNACSSIAWKTLRRRRILLWVDQRSKTTVEQQGESNWMQNGQFRTCCSRFVIQFWHQFVFNVATAGLIEYISKSSRVCEIFLRRPTKEASKSRKLCIYIHLPKGRNCEVCSRTKITRALCRRRTVEAEPRAEQLRDVITAGHTVLQAEGESWKDHWYVVVV